jgi:hypothetical protein
MKKDTNSGEITEGIVKVMNSLEEKGYTSVWMPKENVKTLRSLLEEKYPNFKMEKLSGTETQFIFVSIKQ